MNKIHKGYDDKQWDIFITYTHYVFIIMTCNE
jgi:hypothetical protein